MARLPTNKTEKTKGLTRKRLSDSMNSVQKRPPRVLGNLRQRIFAYDAAQHREAFAGVDHFDIAQSRLVQLAWRSMGPAFAGA